jgi:hypothetical protein
VRPVLNLKLDKDVRTMRAIAEEAFAMVSDYKGAHSGEHGDGPVRSEFHEAMYGRPLVALFEQVRDRFDPQARLNPARSSARNRWMTGASSASLRTIARRRLRPRWTGPAIAARAAVSSARWRCATIMAPAANCRAA